MAVIVILAVIALIATPIIMNVISDSRRGAAKDSGYAIIKAGELATAKSEFEFPATYDETSELNYKGTKPTKMSLKIESNGSTTFTGFIDGYCVVKDSSKSEVVIDETKKTAETCVVAKGEDVVVDLKDGLIPITFQNGKPVKADKNKWFDYDAKQWANAVSVTTTSRNTYQTASAGTDINIADILGYFVYIPRYRYQLWNAENGVSNEQEIKIEFEKESTSKSNGTKNGEWLTHPAFTFGNDELKGIWVGKFEMTGTSAEPKVLPNEVNLGDLNIATFFNTIKKMQSDTYGLSSYDAHMMKNMEWGAVAYLSHSKYGKNGKVWVNNVMSLNWESTTGCSGASESERAITATACPTGYGYNESGGFNASTTGNITGIYDMSGGVWEYMMGIMLDASGNPIYKDSGFTATTMPDKKYFDAYQTTTGFLDFTKGGLGDATREVLAQVNGNMSGWYLNHSMVPTQSSPWVTRGGRAIHYSDPGVFNFSNDTGNAYVGCGSRVVLAF